MIDERKKIIELEEIEEVEDVDVFMEKISRISYVDKASAPEAMYDYVKDYVHENEAENIREKLSDEDKELLRLGRIYRKKRKMRKYWVLAATLVLVLALGITSIGGPKKIFETFERTVMGRDQSVVNSNTEDIMDFEDAREEEVYQFINDEYGFIPVRMQYLPVGVEFFNAKLGEEIQRIDISYGREDKVELVYYICPNYRDGSFARDIEDTLVSKDSIEVGPVTILIKQYEVENVAENRWLAEFTYQDVQYYIMSADMETAEFEKILKNLKFL